MQLYLASWEEGAPVRALTVTAQNLVPWEKAVEQLDLLGVQSSRREKQGKIEQAVYDLRQRFGQQSIGPASIFANELFSEKKEEEES